MSESSPLDDAAARLGLSVTRRTLLRKKASTVSGTLDRCEVTVSESSGRDEGPPTISINVAPTVKQPQPWFSVRSRVPSRQLRPSSSSGGGGRFAAAISKYAEEMGWIGRSFELPDDPLWAESFVVEARSYEELRPFLTATRRDILYKLAAEFPSFRYDSETGLSVSRKAKGTDSADIDQTVRAFVSALHAIAPE